MVIELISVRISLDLNRWFNGDYIFSNFKPFYFIIGSEILNILIDLVLFLRIDLFMIGRRTTQRVPLMINTDIMNFFIMCAIYSLVRLLFMLIQDVLVISLGQIIIFYLLLELICYYFRLYYVFLFYQLIPFDILRTELGF